MKPWSRIFVFIAALFYHPLMFANNTPVGNWVTIDDKSGLKRALVHMVIQDGVLSGTVLKVYPRPGDTGLCSACPGDFKDKPIQGLQIVWGLTDDGEGRFEGGHILDAKTGKIYRVKMKVEGDKLIVRAYIGLALLGRTQTWERA